jgi:hypothetical protein
MATWNSTYTYSLHPSVPASVLVSHSRLSSSALATFPSEFRHARLTTHCWLASPHCSKHVHCWQQRAPPHGAVPGRVSVTYRSRFWRTCHTRVWSAHPTRFCLAYAGRVWFTQRASHRSTYRPGRCSHFPRAECSSTHIQHPFGRCLYNRASNDRLCIRDVVRSIWMLPMHRFPIHAS